MLYNVSFFFLIVSFLYIPKLIWPNYETDWPELVALCIYNAITFLYFYKTQARWIVLLKSLISVTAVFVIANYVEDIISSLLK